MLRLRLDETNTLDLRPDKAKILASRPRPKGHREVRRLAVIQE